MPGHFHLHGRHIKNLTLLTPDAFLTALMPQAFGLLRQSVAGRWFSTVAANLSHPITQLLNALHHFRKSGVTQSCDWFFPLIIGSFDFFFTRHLQRLYFRMPLIRLVL
jgi:hypothetical protein